MVPARRSTIIRLILGVVLVVALVPIGSAYFSYQGADAESRYERQSDRPFDERDQVVEPTDGTTVISTQGTGGDGPKDGEILAFAPDGRVLYHNDTYRSYWDVDPVPGTASTVVYVASTPVEPEGGALDFRYTRQIVETLNLTTGEVDRLYTETTFSAKDGGGKWHDVDRLNETHLLVGDITDDSVFVVDTDTGIVTWQWNAMQDFPPSDGGGFLASWTHLNDVEMLSDGRVMASPRNFDRVIFIDRQTGVDFDWTLGEEDNHSILYEQHNPDYIPEERGGPAVLVADSENDRIVEYRRQDGSWTLEWEWQTLGLEWPRDADRLPDGSTLVTDTHGNRVLQVDTDGAIDWSVEVYRPYEAERLETGDESQGGSAANALGLESRTDGTQRAETDAGRSTLLRLAVVVKSYVPAKVESAIQFARPFWFSNLHFLLLAVALLDLVAWASFEASIRGIRLRSPITRRR
jgi:hypothetical protein